MKALIIDDEFTARGSIKLMVNFIELGFDTVLEADNGKTGLELIKQEKPDLILMDMKMPGMDGVGLLNVLERLEERFKIIVISGFSDFEYTKVAIRSKVIDYILKPIKKEELTAAINKALQEIQAEEMSGKTETTVSLAGRKLAETARKFVEPDLESFWQYLAEAGFKEDNCQMTLAEIKLTNFEHCIRSSFGSYSIILMYKMEEMINEFFALRTYRTAVKTYLETREAVVVLQQDSAEIDISKETIVAWFRELAEMLKQKLGLECIISIKIGITEVRELQSMFREVRRTLKNCNLLENPKVLLLEKQRHSGSTLEHTFNGKEDYLAIAVKNGDTENAIEILSSLFSDIRLSGRVSIFELELLCIGLVNILSSVLEAEGIEFELSDELSHTASDFLKITSDINAAEAWMKELTSKAVQHVKSVKKDNCGRLLADMLKYIDTYYYEQIDREMLSKKFHISKEHISRLFKKELGESFISYITGVRLKKAMELLLKDPDLKLQYIADVTGFNDVSYFSKVFKKQFGVSPADFRNTKR